MKIYYDGDCYFCTNFVKLLRLREAVGEVELLSLRDDNPDVRRILDSGLNVNSGFVVEDAGRTFQGARAFHYLNTLVEPRNLLSRVLYWISGSAPLARLLYPLMVFGRYVVLVLQGGALIETKRAIWEGQGQEGIGPRSVRLALLLLAILGCVRLWLHANFPLSAPFVVSVSILTATTAIGWVTCFLRAAYAQGLFARIRHANWPAVLGFVCLWLAVVNAFDLISVRRIAGFVAVFPLLSIAVDLYRLNRALVGRVPAAAPLALLLFVTTPGLYLAPFYGGIAGWTLTVDNTQPVGVSGYKLVNDAGEEVWYNHAFFQPITMSYRFDRAFLGAGLGQEAFMKFMLDNYKSIYPTLARGRMPSEWFWGKLAYPSHNLSDSNALDYVGRFSPERIVEIRSVAEFYSRDDVFIRSEVVSSYRASASAGSHVSEGE